MFKVNNPYKLHIKAILPILLSRLGKKTPLEVFHRITTKCNLRCKYCGIWMKKNKEMNTSQIKQAIREFADAGTISWAFTGGEPLLRKDMGELIDFADDHGIRTTITTNGLLFKKRFDEIRRVDKIYFSLDGPKETHEKMRGKGTYDKVIEAIKLAKEEGFTASISTVVNKNHAENNFLKIKYLLNLAKKFDLKIKLSPISEHGSSRFDETVRRNSISLEDYFSILTLIKEFSKKEHGFIHFSSEFSSGMYNEAIKIYRGEKSELKCYAGNLFCYLFADGTVSPCPKKTDMCQDGLKNGFLNAFHNLPSNINCSKLCAFTSRNLLLSLNPTALKDALFTIE